MRAVIITPYILSRKFANFLSLLHWYFEDIHLDWKSNDLDAIKADIVHNSKSFGKVNLFSFRSTALQHMGHLNAFLC